MDFQINIDEVTQKSRCYGIPKTPSLLICWCATDSQTNRFGELWGYQS
jgi:hypothetical protein